MWCPRHSRNIIICFLLGEDTRFGGCKLGRLIGEFDSGFGGLLISIIEVISFIISLVSLFLFFLTLFSSSSFHLLLALLLLSVVLGRGRIRIFLEFLLRKQEVDLHPLVTIWQMIDFIDTDHLVECLRLLFVIDLEENAQFIVAPT